NLFDYYLENASLAFEDPDISPIPRPSTKATSSFITPRRPIPSLNNLAASPILRRKGISSFITHRSITTRLEPEDLDDSFSLPHITKILLHSISIHPEETDPVSPVIVDINPPNEEPIRTPTPKAPLVNQLDPVNEAPLPLLPPIQNPLLPNNMAQVQALMDAANAINSLAVALGQAMAYMKDNAQEWASSLANAPTHFQNDNHGQNDQN
ncbi:22_t:CDS:2, partial [Gigaspora margarita]